MCHIAKHIAYQIGSREEPETTPFIWQEKFDIIFYEIKYGNQLKRIKENTKIYRGSIYREWLLPWELRKKSTRKELRRRSCKADSDFWEVVATGSCCSPLCWLQCLVGSACLETWEPLFLWRLLLMGSYCWTSRIVTGYWAPARPFILP